MRTYQSRGIMLFRSVSAARNAACTEHDIKDWVSFYSRRRSRLSKAAERGMVVVQFD